MKQYIITYQIEGIGKKYMRALEAAESWKDKTADTVMNEIRSYLADNHEYIQYYQIVIINSMEL